MLKSLVIAGLIQLTQQSHRETPVDGMEMPTSDAAVKLYALGFGVDGSTGYGWVGYNWFQKDGQYTNWYINGVNTMTPRPNYRISYLLDMNQIEYFCIDFGNVADWQTEMWGGSYHYGNRDQGNSTVVWEYKIRTSCEGTVIPSVGSESWIGLVEHEIITNQTWGASSSNDFRLLEVSIYPRLISQKLCDGDKAVPEDKFFIRQTGQSALEQIPNNSGRSGLANLYEGTCLGAFHFKVGFAVISIALSYLIL